MTGNDDCGREVRRRDAALHGRVRHQLTQRVRRRPSVSSLFSTPQIGFNPAKGLSCQANGNWPVGSRPRYAKRIPLRSAG
jgi:hypothetical protein